MSSVLIGTVKVSKNNDKIIGYLLYNIDNKETFISPEYEVKKALEKGRTIKGLSLNSTNNIVSTINDFSNYKQIYLDNTQDYRYPLVVIAELSDGTYNVVGYIGKNTLNITDKYELYNTTLEQLIDYAKTQGISNAMIVSNKIIPLKDNEPFDYIEVGYTEKKGVNASIDISELSPELKLTSDGYIYLDKSKVTQLTNFEDLYIPSGVKGIRARAFEDSLYKSIIIGGDTCEIIGTKAFKGMSNLKEITLNTGLKRINALAFEECSSLEQIEMPTTIEEIAGTAFKKCSNLKKIIIPRTLDTTQNFGFFTEYGKIIEVR